MSGETLGTKRCPRCGATMFADMEVCYACLYDFTRTPAPPRLPTLGEEGEPAPAPEPAVPEGASAPPGRESPEDGVPRPRDAAPQVVEVRGAHVVVVVRP